MSCDLSAPLGCASIKAANPYAITGRYCIWPFGQYPVPCLCDFDADGGPYTVFQKESLNTLINENPLDFEMETDSILLLTTDEFRDGVPTTQRKGVLAQLPEYSDLPIRVSVNTPSNFQYPENADPAYLGEGYLYFGFLPDYPEDEAKGLKWGLTVNGEEVYVYNTDGNANAYFALWPGSEGDGMLERGDGFYCNGTLCNRIVNNLEPFNKHPLVMEVFFDWVWAAETHWGGGGCYGTTAGDDDIMGLNIGMRLDENCGARKYAPSSCSEIIESNPDAKSGEYCIWPFQGTPFLSFCDFDAEGGPYTIIPEHRWQYFIQYKIAEKLESESLLLVTRDVDNNQRKGVLRQLPEYSYPTIQIVLDGYECYQEPVNADPMCLAEGYLYFGFIKDIPYNLATGLRWGLMVNDQPVTVWNTDGNANAYFAIWPGESSGNMCNSGNGFYSNGTLCNEIVDNLLPSDYDLSDEYFVEAVETHWGGGGCFGTTTSDKNINALAIGIKL